MVGWSIKRAAVAVALASVAAVPAVAQDWTPPPQSDDGYQSAPDDGYQQAPDDGYRPNDDRGYDQPQTTDPDDGYQNDNPGSSNDDGDDAPPAATAPYGNDDNDQGYAPDDGDDSDDGNGQAYPPGDADGGFGAQDTPAVAPQASAAPQSYGEDNNWREWHDPGGAAPVQPATMPAYQRSAGIATRDQAMNGCLTAVRARIGGVANASRVDGIRGEWMVSGSVGSGQPFYCSIRHGAVDGVELGG